MTRGLEKFFGTMRVTMRIFRPAHSSLPAEAGRICYNGPKEARCEKLRRRAVQPSSVCAAEVVWRWEVTAKSPWEKASSRQRPGKSSACSTTRFRSEEHTSELQ